LTVTTPLATSDESDGYATFASTTVVSARTRLDLNTLASTGLANNSSTMDAGTMVTPPR
jgi:hypothetical protein